MGSSWKSGGAVFHRLSLSCPLSCPLSCHRLPLHFTILPPSFTACHRLHFLDFPLPATALPPPATAFHRGSAATRVSATSVLLQVAVALIHQDIRRRGHIRQVQSGWGASRQALV